MTPVSGSSGGRGEEQHLTPVPLTPMEVQMLAMLRALRDEGALEAQAQQEEDAERGVFDVELATPEQLQERSRRADDPRLRI